MNRIRVYITKVKGICGTDVGRGSYRGYQRLMLGDVCFGSGSEGAALGKGVIMHELMHILGFYHEMARPDRDSHVIIHWPNIQVGMEYNFDKYDSRSVNMLGLPYDYESCIMYVCIMHYSRYDFSRTGYIPTVSTRKYFDANLGQRYRLSELDLLTLNKAYNCGGANSLEVKPNKAPSASKPKPRKPNKSRYASYSWY